MFSQLQCACLVWGVRGMLLLPSYCSSGLTTKTPMSGIPPRGPCFSWGHTNRPQSDGSLIHLKYNSIHTRAKTVGGAFSRSICIFSLRHLLLCFPINLLDWKNGKYKIKLLSSLLLKARETLIYNKSIFPFNFFFLFWPCLWRQAHIMNP